VLAVRLYEYGAVDKFALKKSRYRNRRRMKSWSVSKPRP